MDVGSWLRGLGLAQYEALFRDNEVEADVLADLTESDLEKIGLPLGPRKRVLKAIASLDPTRAPPVASSPAPRTPAADAAERRQLTVMFCDLVGSTALSARLDPEDMRQVIRAYQDACSGVVARYDGFVAKFMGDGLLAYFGFPRAHEDDAARAVHAGLEIADAVAGLQTRAREKLAVRIGIATGLVVVGDLVGQGSAQEQAVIGDTPNLAARLQGLAEPGTVAVAASTRRLLGDRFRLRDLGRQAIKGLVAPVEAWVALGVSESEGRFEPSHTARLTRLVGREAEATDLLQRQRRAWGGEGQVVLISGEAGIGKSRFSAWLGEQVAGEAHTRLRYQCSPYHRDSALYPFVQQLERAAGIGPRESADVRLDKLEKVLSLATDRMNEVAPLIASMLSIPLGQRYRELNLSPAQQRRQTLSAMLDQMEGLARKQPVLMLFEDAHWADATSLEVLDLAIERVRRLPVLLLITFRPEFEAPWKGLPDVATIALGRLDPVQAETLVELVTGGRRLPAEVLVQILAKTDGVPLFVEELTKTVIESGLLIEDGDRYRLNGPLPPLAIPSTLQDSLMARLDRLAAVKEIAQIGAAIGREFSYALLHAVVDYDEATLKAALAQLEDSELVFRSGEVPAALYTFKHALVQDTAYESLLRSRRQILHRRIAEAFREKFATVVDAEPELVAHHFTQAGLAESAIEYWGMAGDLALRRSAFKEAIAHLGKAIEMADAGGAQGRVTRGARLKLQVAYGNALMAARGYGAPETTEAFARARETATHDGDTPERLSVAYGLWAGSYLRGELALMREHAAAFLHDVETLPNPPEACVAHRANGITNWFVGEFVVARGHFAKALAVFDPESDGDLAFRFGHDPGVGAMAYQALTLWPLGEIDEAVRLSEDVMARTSQITHVATIAYARLHVAMFEMMRGDVARATLLARGLVDFTREHELKLWGAFAVFLDGWTASRAGDSIRGRAEMRRGFTALKEQNSVIFDGILKTALAKAEAQAGDHSAAIATLDLAILESGRTGQRWFDAELHRVRGEILLEQDLSGFSRAEEAFLAAVATAQRQKARSFEIRAALPLAKLYRASGRNGDVRAVLGPALNGLSPRPDFPEIEAAQHFLDSL
jgi:class 3 adenylate cyclase/predicted ATPase